MGHWPSVGLDGPHGGVMHIDDGKAPGMRLNTMDSSTLQAARHSPPLRDFTWCFYLISHHHHSHHQFV
jgi:hypothetical protein